MVDDDQNPPLYLARVAYDAYGHSTGGKNYQGNPMPEFDDLGEGIQAAWAAAANAVAINVGAELVRRQKAWLRTL